MNARRLPADRSSGRRPRPHRRSAFTLLELIATLLSATVLLAGLATTVAVAVSLLDTPQTQSSNTLALELQDRMAMDLRYSTTLSTPNSSTIGIARTSPVSALPEQVAYSIDSPGLRRKVDSNAFATLDSAQAGFVASSDSYAVPAVVATKSTCLQSVSKAATSGSSNNLSVSIPPGCIQGDLLLLCVSGGFATSGVSVPVGWAAIRDVSRSPIRQVVFYRYCGANESAPVTITSSTSNVMAAVMVAISNAHPSNPVSYSTTATGYSIIIAGLPNVLEPPTSNASRMLLQFVAAEGNQWPGATFALASYVDAAHNVASPSSSPVSLGVATRHGTYPGLSATPRVGCASLGKWVHTAVEIEVTP